MEQGIKRLLYIIIALLLIQTGFSAYGLFAKRQGLMPDTAIPFDKGVPAIKSMPDLPPTELVFDSLSHDFGVIPDNKKAYTRFSFKNTGKEPLLIVSAEASCGCTVPSWPKEPIAPGKESFVEIAFDPTGKLGEHSKIITLHSNAVPNTSILTIKATIVKSN